MRGKIDSELTPQEVLKFTESYAFWMGKGSKILVGRDTRNSSLYFLNTVISGLLSMGITVFDAGVIPTPLILHGIQINDFDGGVIVTGSHNPEEYNGVKYISRTGTFIGNEEISAILEYYDEKKSIRRPSWNGIGIHHQIQLLNDYQTKIEQNMSSINTKKSLKVIIDSNAGTAIGVIDKILEKLGYTVKNINDSFKDYPNFPRPIEPIAENLISLKNEVVNSHYDIGFAYDCDADRVTVVDDKGNIYPEDISVLILVDALLSENFRDKNPKKAIVVTNIASSLAFDVIAKKYQAEIYRVPIGERYLAIKMKELQVKFPNAIIFGGEGSSGGFMYPSFNNARDGIFATCKICELLTNTQKKFKELVEELPKFYSLRKSIQTSNPIDLMNSLKHLLTTDGKSFVVIENDIRIVNEEKEEWVLIHPSNTEPIIRIIAESTSTKNTKNLVKMIENYMQRS